MLLFKVAFGSPPAFGSQPTPATQFASPTSSAFGGFGQSQPAFGGAPSFGGSPLFGGKPSFGSGTATFGSPPPPNQTAPRTDAGDS